MAESQEQQLIGSTIRYFCKSSPKERSAGVYPFAHKVTLDTKDFFSGSLDKLASERLRLVLRVESVTSPVPKAEGESSKNFKHSFDLGRLITGTRSMLNPM
jgi:hypothetical protein